MRNAPASPQPGRWKPRFENLETKNRKTIMARYVSLLRFTPQGVKNLKQSPARAAAFCKAAEKAGVKVEAQLWTTGQFDGILILNATSETKALGVVAKLVAQGNVSTHTLQAFDVKEFASIVGR
jgi:uncharacterized protein with GYD domain